jgi:predicted chitinase
MTRERVTKPDVTLQRDSRATTTETASRSSQPAQVGVLSRSLEARPLTPAQQVAYRREALEGQRQLRLERQTRAVQRAHVERNTGVRAAQNAWRGATSKTLGVQRLAVEHASTARTAEQTRAAFVAQRQRAILEGMVAGRLEDTVRPALPEMQRKSDLTLGHVADHMGEKAAAQIEGDPRILRNYTGFKNAGATLARNFRAPGSRHTVQDLAGAIGRFRDPGQRGAVESAAFAALGDHPTFPGQLQRALDEQDARLELQREVWQRDLEPAAQRQALEEASGAGAAERIGAARGSGQPLPQGVRNLLETKWNTDLSRVRVHVGGEADALSKKLNARAFTTGSDVFFRAGTWNPTSLEGLQLLAHETWHTVQQAQGLVQAGVDKSQSLEIEARSKGAELSSQDMQLASSGAPRVQARVTSPVQNNAPRVPNLPTNAVQRQVAPTTAAPTTVPVAPTNGADVAFDTLVARLVALVPEDMRPYAASSIPLLLQQSRQSDIRNANQVAYILATARHEARFGQPRYTRSEPLVEDHNPLRTRRVPETRVVDGRRVRGTREQPYRVSHVTGRTIEGDDLNAYYDDAYGGRLGNVRGTSDAADYRGRGLVQLTGRSNYANMSQQLTGEGFQYTVDGVTYGTPEQPINLTANPTHVNRVPELASRITVSGMRQGTFTTRGLNDYITDEQSDFFNARSVVNGDKNKVEPGRTENNGQIVAGYARAFAAVLTEGDAWKNLFPSDASVTPAAPVQRSRLSIQRATAPRASSGYAPLTTKALQRDPQPSSKPIPKGTPVNRRGGVIHEKDGGGVNLRSKPDGTGAPIRRVPAGTLFNVLEEIDGGWYKVSVLNNGGGNGFVSKDYITLAPDKTAVLHKITPGQPAIAIAEKYYSSAVQRGEDLRFYVNVLHHVNPEGIPNPSGDNWKEAKTLKDYWIWVPSVTFAQTLRGKVKTGSITGGAYDAVRDSAEAMVKATIEQLPGGKQVLETINSIGAGASKVLNNPGAFVSNLGKAVNQGFNNFTANLPKHLEASVVKLFTGTMGNIDIPKTFDATGVLHMGLQMVGGSPQQLQAKLIAQIPGGMTAINAAGEAKTAFSSIQQNGFAPTVKKYYEGADLQTTIVAGVKNYVIGTVVKEGIKMLASLFIPGAGIIQAAIKLYETIKFIWDKIKDITATFNAITSSLAEIAAGNITAAAGKVTTSLVGALGLAVGFLARVAKLDGIGAWVQKKLEPIKKAISSAWDKFVTWFKGLVSKRGSSGKLSSNTANVEPSKGSKAPKTLSAFRTFAAKFGANTSRIKAFTDDKTSDDTHDAKVATGIKFLLNAERTALRDLKGDTSFTLETARNVATQTKKANGVFKAVNIVQNGLGFNYQLIASETVITAIDPAVVAVRLSELKSKPIASLEELKKIEAGVDERYVKDFVLKSKAGELKQEFRAYIGGRASRKLGKSGETDSIALYNKASGRSVSKNNKIFEVTKGRNKGTVIPDFYSAGQVVGDIKDTKEISFDEQLRRVNQIARAKDAFLQEGSQLKEISTESRFDLVVRKNTRVFGPLEEAVNDSGGKIYRILEEKND